MTLEQAEIMIVLAATIALFVSGRFGPDLVALASLLACVLLGLVPAQDAFLGLGHPAVITVACVLVLSRALQVSGAIDALVPRVLPTKRGPTAAILSLCAMAAFFSSFMNNVGALALLLPIGLQTATRLGVTPGRVLMPLAFSASLGGMTTLIGTPPNLIVAAFRRDGVAGFEMFDFTPVGALVAAAGVLFIGVVGWRLVPRRERAGAESFDTGMYLTEARVMEGSRLAGRTLRELGPTLEEVDAQIVGLVLHEYQVTTPSPERVLNVGDVLVVETEPSSLAAALTMLGMKIEADGREADVEARRARPANFALAELAVRPAVDLIGRSAKDIQLRTRFGINLLAISRQGRQSVRRLRSEPMRAGDVLLMQGPPTSIAAFATEYGCIPLASRALHLPSSRIAYVASAAMAGAIIAAAAGLATPAIAFALAVVACLVLRVVPHRQAYDAIEWPVIVVLGALIPVAGAMESTGAAALIAKVVIGGLAQGNPVVGLVVVLVMTMTLSDFINNSATAAVMCPIAAGTAQQFEVSTDPFLMAVAVGASCAFLTPIGHQNNMLVLGPGGFRFLDYWKLGLPLEIVVAFVAVPALLVFWPL